MYQTFDTQYSNDDCLTNDDVNKILKYFEGLDDETYLEVMEDDCDIILEYEPGKEVLIQNTAYGKGFRVSKYKFKWIPDRDNIDTSDYLFEAMCDNPSTNEPDSINFAFWPDI